MMLKKSASGVFGLDGSLSGLDGFSFRDQQLQMASAIESTIANNGQLVVEAGTGTGKTFAYLVPAILSGKRVVVSTATKNLQDQLFNKDLPFIKKLLGSTIKIAHLKGRGNYLCLHRLHRYLSDGRFSSRAIVADLQRAENWSMITKSGDLADMPDIAENSSARPYFTSTVDNCLGQECPDYADCFLAKARRMAQQADLLIINHHLFFADCVLRDAGFGELLPNFDTVVFDEAHNLPEIASDFFGISLTSRQLLLLLRDCEHEYLYQSQSNFPSEVHNIAPIFERSSIGKTPNRVTIPTISTNQNVKTLPRSDALQKGNPTEMGIQNSFDLTTIKKVIDDFRLAVSQLHKAIGYQQLKRPWSMLSPKESVKSALTALQTILTKLVELLKNTSVKSKELQRCWLRACELQNTYKLVTEKSSSQYVHWYETTKLGFGIHLTPLNISESFQKVLNERERSWVFTSATLAVNGDFSHFHNSLGLQEAKSCLFTSPFNYAEQALLYLPKSLPDPCAANYLRALVDVAVSVIEVCHGRTFFLFTSHRMLKEVNSLLQVYVDYPLLVQGDMPKKSLLAEFIRLDNAVLLGTNSFWEGVDVQGEKLSCVIIDKLPFAVPDDPVIKARGNSLREQGIDPFNGYQLPRAVIALKQGAGRLIRDENDSGVLVICDPRILNKPYGRAFINSLPNMRRTRNIETIQEFFYE